MNKTDSKKLKNNALAVLCLSLLFTIVYTILIIVYYEPDTQFFKYGAVLPSIFLYLTFALTAAIVIKGLLDKSANDFKADYNRTTPLMVFGSFFSGLILLVSAINEMFSFINPSESALEMKARYAETAAVNAAPFDLTIPIIIFSLISAVYFLVSPFKKKIRPLSVAFVVRMVMYVVQGYFSKMSPLNSPVRIMDQMSCIAIMIYFVYEARFIVKEDRPRFYLAFAPAAIFLSAVSSISKIVCTFTGQFEFNGNTYSAVFRFAITAYMISRYLPYILSGKYVPAPPKPEDKTEEENKGSEQDKTT